MSNPIMAWLRGDDLREPPAPAPEQKLFMYSDVGSAIRSGTLVHGPGATDMLNAAYGRGSDANSAVFACLSAICTQFPEAPLRIYRDDGQGKRTELADAPIRKLLDRPNPAMTGPVLWHWTQWAKHVHGNAYWRKIRSGNDLTGNVVELWPISPTQIRPWREKGSNTFIDAYRYQYAPGRYEQIAPENIVHFKLGIDDSDHRLGLSPLSRLMHEILGDEEASRWQAQMLANGGAAGMVVEVPKETSISTEQAADLKQRIGAAFGGHNRGSVGVLTGGAKLAPYGYSPEQMDMKGLHRVPEERIAAVLRVPAIIAGLGAGLDRSTFANFHEAREMFAEMTILPLYSFDQATVNTQLLPDFTNDRRIYAAFDITDLRALQEDENQKYTRLNVGVQGTWIRPSEARVDVGLPPDQELDRVWLARQQASMTQSMPKRSGPLEIKAGDVENLPDLLQALVDLAEPAFEKDVARYLDGQRKRLKRRIVEAG